MVMALDDHDRVLHDMNGYRDACSIEAPENTNQFVGLTSKGSVCRTKVPLKTRAAFLDGNAMNIFDSMFHPFPISKFPICNLSAFQHELHHPLVTLGR